MATFAQLQFQCDEIGVELTEEDGKFYIHAEVEHDTLSDVALHVLDMQQDEGILAIYRAAVDSLKNERSKIEIYKDWDEMVLEERCWDDLKEHLAVFVEEINHGDRVEEQDQIQKDKENAARRRENEAKRSSRKNKKEVKDSQLSLIGGVDG